ncbi:MAG: branched-chain amino acid ABC transporter substrate-binding protein [Archaeoglobi archaeon]|jgi:branched-chain amino acid transport system substrate-binding protein|nr:MAG: branched-chain amino acid ABC transporter substrate-binding protein [Archaeoglobi archaeon]
MRSLAILALVLLLAFCVSQPETVGKREKVVIGVLAPLSLPEGSAQEKAARIAVEEINSKGGILGYKVELVVGDDKLDPTVGSAEFRRLATIEKADVIIGGFSSGVMLATMEVMAETKTLFLTDASSPSHSAKVAENYEKYKYWFRLQNNATTFAYDIADMVKMLRENGYEVKKVYIIRDEHIWAEDVVKALKPLLDSLQVEIVKDVKIPRNYAEYEPLILEAEKLNADLIIPIIALAGTGDILVKQWASLKPKLLIGGDLLAANDYAFFEKTGGAANYVIFTADGGTLVTDPITKMGKEFVEKYKAKYGHYPEAHQAFVAYDAVYLYKLAVEEAQRNKEKDPFNSDVLVKYIERFNEKNPVVLTRPIAFAKNHDLAWGDNLTRNWISQWQDGKQVVIYPEHVATGKLKLPPWMK